MTNISLNNNNLNAAAVNNVLITVASWGTSSGTLNLNVNAAPTYDGLQAETTLTGRGWTITRAASVGVLSDDFERADATGIANVGNGWFTTGNATANIVSGNLVRTDNNGYQRLLNPAGGALPANYTVTASIPAATMTNWWGLIGRWNGTNGVRLLFINNRTEITVGDAVGYNDGNVTVPAPSFPASWANNSIDHTIAMRMTGTQIEIICDGQVVTTCTVATNASVTGTAYGICGESQGRAWHSIGTTTP